LCFYLCILLIKKRLLPKVKKTLLILIFGILVNVSFSQEVKSIYKFKKEQKKKIFTYSELDSLVLYDNGSFYRQYHYDYHQINHSELKGNWKIENGFLYLNITESKSSFADKKWAEFNGELSYLVKRRKLIPNDNHLKIYAKQNLKLIE
tara:strand:+ start:300 stop:746 length:447 start_codon:yes stop_codon:yes gene_type:complete